MPPAAGMPAAVPQPVPFDGEVAVIGLARLYESREEPRNTFTERVRDRLAEALKQIPERPDE